MAFKVVGGKLHKKATKELTPGQAPPAFADFKFKLPEAYRPELTDERRLVFAAVVQTVAEELAAAKWTEALQAEGVGPQQLCESIL